MAKIAYPVLHLCLSATLVLAFAFSSTAEENRGMSEGIVSMDRMATSERGQDRARQDASERAREREEKALERMDKARHRGEVGTEEADTDLENQRRKKMGPERDKGSDRRQKMRNGSDGWKFWE